jgi:hypothetical protein
VNASPAPSGIGRHKPAKQNQSSPALVNFHFDFGDLLPVNSKKCDAGNEAAPFREAPPFGAEIDDGGSLRPRRRKAPTQLDKFDPVLPPAKHGRGLGRPDIVAGFEIGGGCREYDGCADVAESIQIGAVGHVIPEIVAHGQTCRCSSQEPLCWRLVQDITETAISRAA